MNWDRLEGQWKQQRGKAEQHWGKIMNDELAEIAGRYEELIGKLQERYGITKEEAKVRNDDLRKTVEQSKMSNGKGMKLQKVLSKKQRLATIAMKSKTRSRKNRVKGN